MVQLADRLLGSTKVPSVEGKLKASHVEGRKEVIASEVNTSILATTPATGLTQDVAKVTPDADDEHLEVNISSNEVTSVSQASSATKGVPAGSAAATERLPAWGEAFVSGVSHARS